MAWTCIYGSIDVNPMGRTQEEKTYILNTVLNHLPVVSSVEGDMNAYVIKNNGYNSFSSVDEFGDKTNNLYGFHGEKTRRGDLKVQDTYTILVETALRYTEYSDGYRKFQKWLCRLAKRALITQCLVQISCTDGQREIISNYTPYKDMYEMTSEGTGEINWCEYLMWDRAKDSWLPIILAYKYYADEENDREAERRINYNKG